MVLPSAVGTSIGFNACDWNVKPRERFPPSSLQRPSVYNVHVVGTVDVTVFISIICCLMYKLFLRTILPFLPEAALRR